MPLTSGFEQGVLGLIREGHFQRVEYLVGDAIDSSGTPELRAAARASERVTITGWSAIVEEMVQADAHLSERFGRPSDVVSLDLVNRANEDRLLIARRFDVDGAGGWQPPADAPSVVVEGVEALMAIQRRTLPRGANVAAVAEKSLAGLLILARFQALVARCLLDPGLPRTVPASVGVESVERPMELGIYEYGPFARRTIDVAAALRDAAAAQAALDERNRAYQAHYDRVTAQSVTEMREKRFLLQLWPQGRDRDKRHKAIEMFEASLTLSFSDLADQAPPWDAPDAVFEAGLRRFAESRHPDDIDAVLGTFASDDRSQLHLMFMHYALEFGGREMQRHWLRARGYAV